MQIVERDTSTKKKNKTHSIRDGKRTHLEEFKRQLHKRKDLVKEIIDEEYNKFENIIEVENEIELMDERRKQKMQQRKILQFEKLKKLKNKVSYEAETHLNKLKAIKLALLKYNIKPEDIPDVLERLLKTDKTSSETKIIGKTKKYLKSSEL